MGKWYSRNLEYSSECTLCPEESKSGKYIGETARSIRERNKEHMEDQRSSSHNINSHRREDLMTSYPEVPPEDTSLLKMKIVRCHSSALTRILPEYILVRKGEGLLLNAK